MESKHFASPFRGIRKYERSLPKTQQQTTSSASTGTIQQFPSSSSSSSTTNLLSVKNHSSAIPPTHVCASCALLVCSDCLSNSRGENSSGDQNGIVMLSSNSSSRNSAAAPSNSTEIVQIQACHFMPGGRGICSDCLKSVPSKRTLAISADRILLATAEASAVLPLGRPQASTGPSSPLIYNNHSFFGSPSSSSTPRSGVHSVSSSVKLNSTGSNKTQTSTPASASTIQSLLGFNGACANDEKKRSFVDACSPSPSKRSKLTLFGSVDETAQVPTDSSNVQAEAYSPSSSDYGISRWKSSSSSSNHVAHSLSLPENAAERSFSQLSDSTFMFPSLPSSASTFFAPTRNSTSSDLFASSPIFSATETGSFSVQPLSLVHSVPAFSANEPPQHTQSTSSSSAVLQLSIRCPTRSVEDDLISQYLADDKIGGDSSASESKNQNVNTDISTSTISHADPSLIEECKTAIQKFLVFSSFYYDLDGMARRFEIYDAQDAKLWEDRFEYPFLYVFPSPEVARLAQRRYGDAMLIEPTVDMLGIDSAHSTGNQNRKFVEFLVCSQCSSYQPSFPRNRRPVQILHSTTSSPSQENSGPASSVSAETIQNDPHSSKLVGSQCASRAKAAVSPVASAALKKQHALQYFPNFYSTSLCRKPRKSHLCKYRGVRSKQRPSSGSSSSTNQQDEEDRDDGD